MSDIQDRLRQLGEVSDTLSAYHLCREAADHIEHQEALIAELRKDAEQSNSILLKAKQHLHLFFDNGEDSINNDEAWDVHDEIDAFLASKASTQEMG